MLKVSSHHIANIHRITYTILSDPSSDPPTFYMHSLYDEQIDAKSLIIQLQLIHNFNLNIYMLWLCTNTDTYQPTCIIDDLIDVFYMYTMCLVCVDSRLTDDDNKSTLKLNSKGDSLIAFGALKLISRFQIIQYLLVNSGLSLDVALGISGRNQT